MKSAHTQRVNLRLLPNKFRNEDDDDDDDDEGEEEDGDDDDDDEEEEEEDAQCLISDSYPETDVADRGRNSGRRRNLESLVWEVIFYAGFLTLLVSTAFDNRDRRSYGFHSSILTATDPAGQFSQVGCSVESCDPPMHVWPLQMWPLPVRCIPSWSSGYRDWADYDFRWTAPEVNISTDTRSPWRYSSWADIGGTPVAGRLGVYPNGGYVQDLAGTLEEVSADLTDLQRSRWVDQWTKVVLIETTIYTPNINMFAMITALFEFPQAMVTQAQLYAHPFKLLSYADDYPVSARIFDFLIFFVIVWFAVRVVLKLRRWRWSFFLKFWNVLELVNLLLGLAVVVLYVGRQVVSDHVAKEAAKTTGQFYNFQTLAMWDQLFGILLGFCCCMSTLKVLHLFRFNRRMSLLGATMRGSAKELAGFAFMYGLIMAAFISF
ncbi:polycystic kidney disease protein 1-like 2, partial [Elysia marginata]